VNKKILVTQSTLPTFDEYCKEIKDIWDSRWLTNMGVKHQLLQSKLQEYLECPNVLLHTNGHLALENALAIYDFPKGKEIITTPFTFASTTHAIVRNGLVPVFCDINYNDYTIDVSKIEGLITKNTVAILPVHVYGNICNIEEIQRIADKHNLKVIYDAAHAFGVKYKGISAANFGDVSMFSFHATKVFNTIEGGALCFKDNKLVEIINDMKNFGIHSQESVQYVGGNAKMNEFQAAMGLCNLRHVDEEIKKRANIYKLYMSLLSNIKGIKLNEQKDNIISNYAYFPVVFDNFKYTRDEVFNLLKDNDIYARKYFYPLTCDFECYISEYRNYSLDVARKVSNNVLTLPIYPDLNENDVRRICKIICN